MTLLFPKLIDNRYRGQWAALVLFVPVLVIKLLIGINISGLNPMIKPYDILQDVDGIPMDSFTAAAAYEIEFATAAWGGALVIIALFGGLAVVRYRALIPVAILMLFLEQSWRQVASIMEKIMAGAPLLSSAGAQINLAFSAALLAALVLSIIPRKGAALPGE